RIGLNRLTYNPHAVSISKIRNHVWQKEKYPRILKPYCYTELSLSVPAMCSQNDSSFPALRKEMQNFCSGFHKWRPKQLRFENNVPSSRLNLGFLKYIPLPNEILSRMILQRSAVGG